MNYLKKTNPAAQRRQRKRGKYHLSATNGTLNKAYVLPIGYILRDLLKLSRNLKETKKYLKENEVVVGNKIIKSIKHPVTFLETIKIKEELYRIRIYRKRKSSLFRVLENQIYSPILSKIRLNPTTYQLNTLGGRNYKVSSEIVKEIPVGSTVIKGEDEELKIVTLVEGSRVFLLSGKNTGNIMVYKTMRNNQYLVAPLLEDNKIVPYNELIFFPITGKVIKI